MIKVHSTTFKFRIIVRQMLVKILHTVYVDSEIDTLKGNSQIYDQSYGKAHVKYADVCMLQHSSRTSSRSLGQTCRLYTST